MLTQYGVVLLYLLESVASNSPEQTCVQSLRLRKGIKVFGAFPEQEEFLGGSNTHS